MTDPFAGEEMVFPDRRTAHILLTILLFALALTVIYSARRILVVFFFAILVAYLLEPLVKLLQRHSILFRNLRGPAVVEAYLAFLILVALLAHAVAPRLLRETSKAFSEIPALLDGVSTGDIATEIGNKYGWSDVQKVHFKALLARHREKIQNFVRGAEELTSSAPQVIAWLVVIPVLAIFFLLDGAHIASALIHIASVGGKYKAVQEVADEMNLVLKKYVRAKVILGGLSLLFYSAAMLLLQFPHAIVLGMLGGVLEFVPAAGWMISAATFVTVGALTHSHWICMAVLLGIWRVIQDYIISPRVMGHQLELHPLMIIFAVMLGWEMGGIVGIYLLVPVIAAARVIWRRFLAPTSQQQSAPVLVHAGMLE